MKWLFENICTEVIAFIIGGILTWIVTNRKTLKLSILALFWRKNDFRLSIAYLFRIKIDNKYLLIKGRRIDQYQPVGGVYKYYESFKDKFELYEIRSEHNTAFYEENDLRIFVKGKYIKKVLDWFGTMKNRECTVYREFTEELILSNYLDKTVLDNIQIEFLNTVNSGIHNSPHFGCKEILIFDVYDVSFIDKKYEKELMDVCKSNNDLILADYIDIKRQCIDIGGKSYKIGAHAEHIR